MSHFTVLVVTNTNSEDELSNALQPFHEYECTGIRDQYVVWVDKDAEVRHEYERRKDDYASVEEFARSWYGIDEEDMRDGKFGRITNPNAKWDYWIVGGRWTDKLLLRNGEHADSAMKRDVDFVGMLEKERQRAAREYDEVARILDGTKFTPWLKIRDVFQSMDDARTAYKGQKGIQKLMETKYFLDCDDFLAPRDEYIDKTSHANWQTFAVLKDGEWKERGEMGWWATVSNENENWRKDYAEIINSIDDDKWLTVVDCHI